MVIPLLVMLRVEGPVLVIPLVLVMLRVVGLVLVMLRLVGPVLVIPLLVMLRVVGPVRLRLAAISVPVRPPLVRVVRGSSNSVRGIRPGWRRGVNGSRRCLVGSLPIAAKRLRTSVLQLDHRMVKVLREMVRIAPSCDRSPVNVAISQRLV